MSDYMYMYHIVSHDQLTIELEKVHAQILNKNMTYKYLLFMFIIIIIIIIIITGSG